MQDLRATARSSVASASERDVMEQRTTSRIRTVLLSVSLIVALAFIGHGLWRNWLWQQEVFGLVGYYGTVRAEHDFKNGQLRLFELDGEQQDDVSTGRSEGPFEIWNPQYLPVLGYPHRYATEQMVGFYNRRMRNMHAHPEQFPTSDDSPVVDDHP
ncbi:MAG TPA: hypothetical protein VMM76_17300 [Pirellulaceae bacterium]|nr:hypothetical protein [Pirellulaceae bacterium]